MALRPLWDNVWGVAIYRRPFREEATIHTPFARQREKIEGLVLIKEVGKDCKELKPGMVVVIPQENGGYVINIQKANGEMEYRYCFSEKVALVEWTGQLPEGTTEAGVINIE
jgi:hypothetical protein